MRRFLKVIVCEFLVPKKQNLDVNQVRLLRCGILPTSSPGVVAFPGSPGFLFFCGCCSESEDSVI